MKPTHFAIFIAPFAMALPSQAAPTPVRIPYTGSFAIEGVYSLGDDSLERDSIADQIKSKFPPGVGINPYKVTQVFLIPGERRSDKPYTLRSPLFFDLEPFRVDFDSPNSSQSIDGGR